MLLETYSTFRNKFLRDVPEQGTKSGEVYIFIVATKPRLDGNSPQDTFHTGAFFRCFWAKNNACKAPVKCLPFSPSVRAEDFHTGAVRLQDVRKSCKQPLSGGAGAVNTPLLHLCHWNQWTPLPKCFGSGALRVLLTFYSTLEGAKSAPLAAEKRHYYRGTLTLMPHPCPSVKVKKGDRKSVV